REVVEPERIVSTDSFSDKDGVHAAPRRWIRTRRGSRGVSGRLERIPGPPRRISEGGVTMIKGLRGATIWSEDLNNLLPFYRDVLGLPIAIQIPGFVVLGKLGAATLALGTHSEVRGRNADP